MENFNLTLALNGRQLDAAISQYTRGETTCYDVRFEDYTLTVYKDTLYTWRSDDPHGLNQADVQSIGEQIDGR